MGTKSRRLRAAVRRPEPPAEVRPGAPRSDLRGRQPVRITAEGRSLVCRGFRGQRVEIRSGSVSAVVLDDDRSLILIDRDGRMLLRAPGDWNSYALGVLCRRAGLPRPTRLDRYAGIRADDKRPYARAWPWSPFYPPGNRRRREQLVTGAMVIAVPALVAWGPGVLIAALGHGPPWAGAALGNLISGALLTLALPVLAWRAARRLRDQRRAAREDLIEGIW